MHERHLETTFGTVEVERLGYARPGHDSLHPLDAALNLPPERYSLEVRRRVAAAAASRSYDETLFELSCSTGAEVPKRQAEQLVVRAAEDFDAFYEARRAEDGQPPPEGSVVVLTFDGKGVVLQREDLRAATRKAAEKRRQQKEQLSRFKRLKPGEKKHSKRMATVAAVYTIAPFERSPEEFLQSLMPRPPGPRPRSCGLARWRNGSGRASNGSRGRWSPRRRWKRSARTPSTSSTGSRSSMGQRRSSTWWKRLHLAGPGKKSTCWGKGLVRCADRKGAWACYAAYAPFWTKRRPNRTLGTLSSSNRTGRSRDCVTIWRATRACTVRMAACSAGTTACSVRSSGWNARTST